MKNKFIKASIIHLLMCVCLTTNLWAQTKVDRELKENKDWAVLDSLKNFFGEPKESLSFLEKRKYNDSLAINKSKLAEAFIDKYPNSSRFQEVLNMYFHYTFEPSFIQKNIPDSIVQNVNQTFLKYKQEKSKNVRSQLLNKVYRTIPINNDVLEQWVNKGKEIENNILKSNADLKDKNDIQLKVLNRDLGLALKRYQVLYKDPKETNFWIVFDRHYWEPFKMRVIALLNKYSSLESMASYVQSFIDYISRYSPDLKELYWKDFFKIASRNDQLINQKAYKLLHKIAKKNLAAIEFLKEIDPNKPLEMKFTDMNGNRVDIANLRGKVVLIDFWSIRCGACIMEMPHVVELYEKYKDQGFEIIGLSADGDGAKESILKILKKYKATWPQSLDKGKDAAVSYHALFNIKSLPTVWLLNKDGIIVDKNARGRRLEPLIREHLGLAKLKFDYKNPSFKLKPKKNKNQ